MSLDTEDDEGKCSGCKHTQLAYTSAKVSDMFHIDYPSGKCHSVYVPNDIGLGSGDYIEFEYCMHCGKIQGEFPVKEPADMVENPQDGKVPSS